MAIWLKATHSYTTISSDCVYVRVVIVCDTCFVMGSGTLPVPPHLILYLRGVCTRSNTPCKQVQSPVVVFDVLKACVQSVGRFAAWLGNTTHFEPAAVSSESHCTGGGAMLRRADSTSTFHPIAGEPQRHQTLARLSVSVCVQAYAADTL